MLQLAVAAVGISHAAGLVRRDQPGRCCTAQQLDVAPVLDQFGVVVAVRQHQELHHELDVHHAAGVVLQVEEPRFVGVAVVHLLAHAADLGRQRAQYAALRQDVAAQLLEHGADARAASRMARPGQRLVLPHPGRFVLVEAEGVLGGHQQPGVAIGPQPQVHLEERAGGGAGLQPAGHALGQLGIDAGRILVRVVVQEHQVQIGRIAKLLAAQPSVGNHRELRIGPVPARQVGPAALQGDFQHRIGQRTQLVAQMLHGQAFFQILSQQPEDGAVVRLAHGVHLALHVGGRAAIVVQHAGQHGGIELLAQVLRPAGDVQWFQQLAAGQFVDHHRMAAQIVAGPARLSHHPQQVQEGFRMLGEHVQIHRAPRNGFQKIAEPPDQRVLAAGFRPGPEMQRLREQMLDHLLRAFAGLAVGARLAQRPDAAQAVVARRGGGRGDDVGGRRTQAGCLWLGSER